MRRVALLLLMFIVELFSAWALSSRLKRVALLIGNVKSGTSTPQPANDAVDVLQSLSKLGFTVTLTRDGTYNDMRQALLKFNQEAKEADIAIVFYAGHGMEVNGENWLIPIDAKLDPTVAQDAKRSACGRHGGCQCE